MRSSSLLLLVALAVCAAACTVVADTCGGNCPSNDCHACPCGTTRNLVNINDWCAKFSGWNQAQCRCIVSHESSGNANALNWNTDSTFDVGVWQVNGVNWGSCSGGHPPCDPQINLGCAIDVWRWGGNTFKLWSTCHGCGACSSEVGFVSGEEPSWNGTFPEWYDATKPIPAAYELDLDSTNNANETKPIMLE